VLTEKLRVQGMVWWRWWWWWWLSKVLHYFEGLVFWVVQIFISFFLMGLAYQGKDVVFSFIIEYSSLRDYGP
jgi:hypothetical protein